MKIETQRFGTIEAPEEEIFKFPAGIPGFAHLKEFIIVEHKPGSPVRWLQSVTDPAVAFVVTDPLIIVDSYSPTLRPSDFNVVEAKEGDSLVLHVILTVHSEPLRMTANMKAPIVFNPRNHLAAQLVLEGADANGQKYNLRHPVPLSAMGTQQNEPAAAAEEGGKSAEKTDGEAATTETPARDPEPPRAAVGGAAVAAP